MTVASGTAKESRCAPNDARVEIAWTVSAGALGNDRSYSSAVLHVTCEWDPACPECPVRCRASLQQAGTERPIRIPDELEASVASSSRWTHMTIGVPGRQPIITASFEHGRLVYCTSTLPGDAGLAGGTYDAPTGILELYDR
jgi:hypothetical protein